MCAATFLGIQKEFATEGSWVVDRAFARLEKLVRDGDVRIVQVVGVPRSMSTALEKSLAEMGEPAAYVNEPFNVQNGDIDLAAQQLLSTFRDKGQPSVLVTKSLAPQIGREEFNTWMSVCESLVWSIRNPLIQMGSLATRLANDRYGLSTHVITQDEVYPYLQRLTEHWMATGFALPGWHSVGDHYRCRPANDIPSVVIDGEDLVKHPARVLKAACSRLPYTFRRDMVSNWRAEPFNNANHAYPSETDDNGLPTDAWISKAARARGLEPNTRTSLDVDRLPSALRHYIDDVAIPTYSELSRAAVRP